jgi:hypothetical protein
MYKTMFPMIPRYFEILDINKISNCRQPLTQVPPSETMTNLLFYAIFTTKLPNVCYINMKLTWEFLVTRHREKDVRPITSTGSTETLTRQTIHLPVIHDADNRGSTAESPVQRSGYTVKNHSSEFRIPLEAVIRPHFVVLCCPV